MSNAGESAQRPTSTTTRLAGTAHEAIDSAAKKAESVEREVRERAAEAAETVDDAQKAAVEKVDESIESLLAFMRKRPVAAVGIAFAAGVFASSLLRR